MWIDPKTGDVARTHADVRALHPNWSGPATMTDDMVAELGFELVLQTSPVFNPITQTATEGKPAQVDGKWQQTWAISAAPDDVRAANLSAAIASQWEAIKAERERRRVGGMRIGADWFHSDDPSRIQQIALTVMGASIPAGLQWKTMTGGFVTMTPALAGQIFTSQVMRDQAIFTVAEKHRVAMSTADNPLEYNIMADWPEMYGA
jgi:hypothetical protein